jgi:hypothetical protein
VPSETIEVVVEAVRLFNVGDWDRPAALYCDQAVMWPLEGWLVPGAGVGAREILARALAT